MTVKENIYNNANAFGKRKNIERNKINGKDERSEVNSGDWFSSSCTESKSQQRPSSPTPTALLPPSPYMMELARLRREKLRIEEKMLLKRRQVLELERLRPPIEKWYEIKDHHFHHEAQRNNSYVKNQKMLPLIDERRRLLYETITS
ncbi:hypothetical protein TNIN_338691 [Trichonephila inaurata madagascariensis]|uniref:Uncharacterized protein n=1 Tax=Trichonephila inaurata madagascariensis TaxID=2747483 RepID=A0A8X6YDC9_9ARAC|nr:hypothetical protein TNIN_338691 [Trichonephila inaurata madagascariensis]